MNINRHRIETVVILALAAGVLAIADSPASAQTIIASQDFEDNSLSRGIPAEATAVALDIYDDTTGVYTMPGLGFDSGVGLGWTYSTDAATPEGVTRGNDNGDVIGVFIDDSKDFGTTNGLAGAPGQTGAFYLVEDADSTWTVAFDPVDTTGFTDLMLSFTWGIDNDGGGSTAGSNFEGSDFIDVTVNGDSVFKVDGVGDFHLDDATGGLDDLDADYINAFTPENIDISALDGQILNISFAIANNAAAEDIAFDNVMVSGMAAELPGDFDGDNVVDVNDINQFCGNYTSGDSVFDVNADGSVDLNYHAHLIQNILGTSAGDADLNGSFGTSDLIAVFTEGKYEQDVSAGWHEGEFNCDGRFDTGDLVAAFQAGTYDPSAAVQAVPEPGGCLLLVLGLLIVGRRQV